MKIESLQVKNFKVFKNIQIKNVPNMAVFLGKNGSGKSTFFDIFGFLNDCLNGNVRTALAKRGGYREVVSREQEGDISFVIKFRQSDDEPLITYDVSIGLDEREQPVVKKEILRFRRGQYGAPWKVLDFSLGEGVAAKGDLIKYEDVKLIDRDKQRLDAKDMLAIKGLGQFKEFEAVAAFRRLIEDWFVADFRIDAARNRQEADYSEQLTRTGENLSVVAKYLFDNRREEFQDILEKMRLRIPGVESIEASVTQDGYVILRFQDGKFKNPFSSKYVSDGTIKMFTYLVLLHERERHTLLCIEEPENQLYPGLLEELAEEFRLYADQGGQVFISTHSPDFLNAIELEEIFLLKKVNGYTDIVRASNDALVKELCKAGDKPGYLWKQGLMGDV